MIIKHKNKYVDKKQLQLSHGYENMDLVAQESFINHIHFHGKDKNIKANKMILSWITDMINKYPKQQFRIYKEINNTNVIIRFHAVRNNLRDYAESGYITYEINKK